MATDAGPYLLGLDFGSSGCRAGLFDTEGTPLHFTDTTFATAHPRSGWAEQNPDDWWAALADVTRRVLAESGVSADAIAGIGYGATSATLVALDAQGRPTRDAIMWMDVRATEQADRGTALDHPVSRYNGGGTLPATAEWFPFKAAWLAEHDAQAWARTRWLLDAPDWVGFMLTGEPVVNLCSASLKYYHDNDLGGWPVDFYEAVGAGGAFAKMPTDVRPMGERLGVLTQHAAEHLGLRAGTPVGLGGVDAECGIIGLNVLAPGRMALVTGTAQMLLGQVAEPISGPGFFGAHTDAVVVGQYTVEASQSAAGSALRWFRDNFARDVVAEAERTGRAAFDLLNERSKDVPLGSDGIIVNEYFQGNRSPYTDSRARATITGLSLSHGPAHLYHAIQEGVCYGTEHNLRVLKAAGNRIEELIACGGALRSPSWMQMHADVTGLPITTTRVQEATSLGAAMIGGVGAGLFPDLAAAGRVMVHEQDVIVPDPDRHEQYRFYVDQYVALYPGVRDIQHRIAAHEQEDA